MIEIRKYTKEDSMQIGQLILEIYRDFNLDFAKPKQQKELLGPFYYAHSNKKEHIEKIAETIQAKILLVALYRDKIVGVLRGKEDKLQSLFVDRKYHRKGIGRKLVDTFEKQVTQMGGNVIKLMSTIYAIQFYQSIGYKKTTGIRIMKTFDGSGLPYQPMKKILVKLNSEINI